MLGSCTPPLHQYLVGELHRLSLHGVLEKGQFRSPWIQSRLTHQFEQDREIVSFFFKKKKKSQAATK